MYGSISHCADREEFEGSSTVPQFRITAVYTQTGDTFDLYPSAPNHRLQRQTTPTTLTLFLLDLCRRV